METNIIEQNGKRYRVTIVEEVEVVYDYLSGHRASGLKVGDKVKVVRKSNDKEGGWGDIWAPSMCGFVANEYEIQKDDNDFGFVLNDWRFPYFVLEKVKEKKVTYEDVFNELNPEYYITNDSQIDSNAFIKYSSGNINQLHSEEVCKKYLALFQLDNVAEYLNYDIYKDVEWKKNGIYLFYRNGTIGIWDATQDCSYGTIRFKTIEIAKEAIEILGKKTIKMALK